MLAARRYPERQVSGLGIIVRRGGMAGGAADGWPGRTGAFGRGRRRGDVRFIVGRIRFKGGDKPNTLFVTLAASVLAILISFMLATQARA